MYKIREVTLALALLLLASPIARAWNAAGHRLIALIAYDGLEPETQSALLEILKAHPRFGPDFLDQMPDAVVEASPAEQDRWLFAQAAIWPDIARDFEGPLRTQYHHSTWHYIDTPLFASQKDERYFGNGVTANVGTNWTSGMASSQMNILQALQKAKYWLSRTDASVSKSDKAIYLCWLIHLVGDLHEPLHSTALFSHARFPKGDLGGNSIVISGQGNLHSIWDGYLGNESSLEALSGKAREIRADATLSAIATTAAVQLDFLNWCDESRELAAQFAYVERIREAAQEPAANDGEAVILDSLPEGYATAATGVATQAAANAGFRLAAVLKEAVHH